MECVDCNGNPINVGDMVVARLPDEIIQGEVVAIVPERPYSITVRRDGYDRLCFPSEITVQEPKYTDKDRLEFLIEENLTVVQAFGDYQLVDFLKEKYFMKGDNTITILSSSNYRDLIDIAINIKRGG